MPLPERSNYGGIGIAAPRATINAAIGETTLDLRRTMHKITDLSAFLDTVGKDGLIDRGFTDGESDQILDLAGRLADLAGIYHGRAMATDTDYHRAFSVLWGGQ